MNPAQTAFPSGTMRGSRGGDPHWKLVDFLRNTGLEAPPLANHTAIAISIRCRAI